MTTNEKVLIKVENLQKSFEDNKVLDGNSTEIRQGEVAAVIGPSGSGKSTLLNMIGLLDRPDRGTYCLEGEDTTALDDRRQAAGQPGVLDRGFIAQHTPGLDAFAAQARAADWGQVEAASGLGRAGLPARLRPAQAGGRAAHGW